MKAAAAVAFTVHALMCQSCMQDWDPPHWSDHASRYSDHVRRILGAGSVEDAAAAVHHVVCDVCFLEECGGRRVTRLERAHLRQLAGSVCVAQLWSLCPASGLGGDPAEVVDWVRAADAARRAGRVAS